jgi:hypothetical protein
MAAGVAAVLVGCQGPAVPKSLILQDEERRPIGAWQQIAVAPSGEITRVYVLNSRSGFVCEHEFMDSPIEPARRIMVVNCSAPGL